MALAGTDMIDAAYGLNTAGKELVIASTNLDRAAEMLFVSAKVEKADKWIKLIKSGVDAYSAGGSRAHGGPVYPGKIHQVTEHGPEMLYQGNKTYLLPDKQGKVVPLKAGAGNESRRPDVTNITMNWPPALSPETPQQIATATARALRVARARNT
jgi:hypothetical protein